MKCRSHIQMAQFVIDLVIQQEVKNGITSSNGGETTTQ
jgi:hypothetical protein